MQVYRDSAELRLRNTVVAIGVFDGVHLGHQAVMREACSLAHAPAHNFNAVAFTFDIHPSRLLAPERAPATISTLAQRTAYIAQLGGGIDVAITEVFTPEFASQSPDDFVERILIRRLGVRHVFIGADFRYGTRRSGGTDTLIAEGNRYGFGVTVVPPVIVEGDRVSSTRIRDAVVAGDLTSAARLLGHPFVVAGTVVVGKKLGRDLGFPTANLQPEDDLQLLPADGVYAGWALLSQRRYRAAISVGTNPTTDSDGRRKVEAYLMDGFDADLYGQSIEIDFRYRIRGQVAFDDLDALRRRIAQDVAETEALLIEKQD